MATFFSKEKSARRGVCLREMSNRQWVTLFVSYPTTTKVWRIVTHCNGAVWLGVISTDLLCTKGLIHKSLLTAREKLDVKLGKKLITTRLLSGQARTLLVQISVHMVRIMVTVCCTEKYNDTIDVLQHSIGMSIFFLFLLFFVFSSRASFFSRRHLSQKMYGCCFCTLHYSSRPRRDEKKRKKVYEVCLCSSIHSFILLEYLHLQERRRGRTRSNAVRIRGFISPPIFVSSG